MVFGGHVYKDTQLKSTKNYNLLHFFKNVYKDINHK